MEREKRKVCLRSNYCWQRNEVQEVQTNVHYYEEHLQSSELHRLLLISQIRERYRLNGIESHHARHHQYVLLMIYIAQPVGNRVYEEHYGSKEQHRQRTHHAYRRREDAVRILPLLVGKAEEGRLHAEGEDHQQQCHVGIQVRHHAVATT